MSEGKIFVITGCSGSGKTEISKNLLKKKELKLTKITTCTTREPRNGEVNGKDYFFLTKNEFLRNIEEKKMFEWAKVYGNYYGSRKEDVEKILKKGKNVLFVVDVKGALKIKKENKCFVIFIEVESLEELRRRLISRGSDSEETIEKRIKEAKKEMSYSKKFDRIVLNKNGKIFEAIDEISSYILSLAKGN